MKIPIGYALKGQCIRAPISKLILRRTLGLPLQLLEGPWAILKGQVLYETAMYTVLHNYDALCPFYNSVLGSVCETVSLLVVHFQVCWLIMACSCSLSCLYYSGGWQPCQLCKCVLVSSICQYQKDIYVAQ